MRVLLRLFPGLALMALGALSFAAYAQPSPGDLTSLTSATPSGDWSIKLWKYIFGSFAENPFSPGGPTTLMGNIFIIFNSAIFVVGFTWAMYGIVGGIVQTAHEGEVLGKRMSTVWFPIRMVMGIGGMVPIFGGFTMYQAIMMMLTTVGIGIGNSLWVAGVESTSSMQALINESQFVPSSVSQVRNSVQNMFLSGVCVAAQRAEEAATQPPLPQSQLVRIEAYVEPRTQAKGYKYGSLDDQRKCGYVTVQANARSESSMLAYRAGGVNYRAIEASASNTYVTGMASLVQQTAVLADQWYQARRAAMAADAAPPPIPMETLNALTDDFIRNAAAAISQYNTDGGALQNSVKNNMLTLGWFGAGAWYSTFAEANAAIADAAKGPTMTSKAPSAASSTINTETAAALKAVSSGFEEALKAQNADTGDGTRAILDSAIRDSCSIGGIDFDGSMGTATSNCSLGQSIVSAAIRATAIGSGGGGNSTATSFDSTGLVNPIIMMKNMGDYVMSFSSTILITGFAMDMLGDKLLKFIPGGQFVGAALSAKDATSGPSKTGTIFEVLKVIAVITLVLGALMAVYIPLVPFITWMGAILAYAASVIEGLAGGSLHAMAHLDGDGDGLGQRTAHGYLFFINVLGRPSLMIIGFFVASALMITVGTLQAHLFLPAMANVQGNSITGIASIIAFLLVFFVMNVTLISAAFNLIYVITDQVIGFVGGQINSTLGRDTEDKVHGVFLMAGRVGPQAIGQVGQVRAGANKLKADALRAAAGNEGAGKPKG